MSSAPAASKAKAKPKTNMLEDFALGGLSAAISKTVAAPIERVKLLLQNQGEAAAITKPYTGIVDVFIRVPKEQGIASFWRGNMANVIRYFPTQALNFMFKDFYKQYLEQPRSAGFIPCLLGNMASGGAAGATSLVVVYPLDFARTRLAMDVGKGDAREFTGTVDCILKTAKQSGWGKGGVYNGFTISCVGIIFYRGAYFGLYDTINDQDFMRKGGFGTKFAVGYAVTVTAGLLSYPLDTIRRRLMMTSGKHAGKYKSSMDAFSQIMKNEGAKALYKGAGSNILRGLAGALVLVGFDYCKNFYLEWKYPELKGQKKEIKIQFG
jgi:solute carrier family 25 (adenine nucleotide translocator) protein 4/5/6/31